MDDIQNRLKNLSPEKRALIEKHLREKALQKVESHKIPIRKDTSSFPMSFDQERLWFLSTLNPKSAFYNIPAILKLRGKLDYSSLENAINKVLDRHEILNVIFETDKGSPKQVISKINFSLEVLDTELRVKDEIIKNELNVPFDLERGPLYKIRLLRISETEHILIFILHHLIADGWSVTLLINEISSYYNYEKNPTGQTIDPLEIQYFDYAEWQHESYNNGNFDRQLEYWTKKLADLPQTTGYYTDKKRPPVQTYNGDKLEFKIDQKIMMQLKKIGQNNNLSPFMLFFTAFEIMLFRFSTEKDFAIGIPVANRKNDAIKNLVGFFVNTLAIRSTCSLDLTIKEFFISVKEKILEAFENQDIPFEKIVENVVHERSTANSPLFQTMFDYQESPLSHLVLEGIEIELVDIKMETAKFDLLLTIEDRENSAVASFEYNTDLFFRETIENLAKVFNTILQSISESTDIKVGNVDCVPEHQYDFLNKLNNTRTDYPKSSSVIDLFEDIVSKYPDTTAVTFDDQIITYSELNKRANILANKLTELGVKKGEIVSVYLEQSPEMIIAFIAILKTGAAYLPMDIAYPQDRIKFMLEDTGSGILITNRNFNIDLKSDTVKKIIIEEVDFSDDISGNYTRSSINPEEPAYIIYTSGSTGKPKGVIVPHKAIVRLVRDTNYFDPKSSDIIAQISNASFDAATFEIWGSLLNGIKLAIIEKENILSYEYFYNLIKESNITILFITTSLFNQYAKFNPRTFNTLRSVYFGGEVSDPESVKLVYDANPKLNVYHVYGPTENTTFTTYHLITEKDFTLRGLPIGKSISNTSVYVADETNRLVPIGFPGELLIGGDGLALGYHNREELNNERFINVHGLKEEKLYKSGDLVRVLNDGSIDFLGRKDAQIKLRGFRIELGEIESAVKQYHGIEDCAVILYGRSSEDKTLVAFYVTVNGITDENLKNSLRNTLPEYMIPGIFQRVPKIPVTPNGKLDRRALLNLLKTSADSGRPFLGPRNSLEKYLVDLWKDVLGINKVGVYDNFFEIGGNSLKAAVLMNRIEKDFNTTAHVAAIFKVPYIAEFANYVSEYYPEIVADRFKDASYKIKSDVTLTAKKIDQETIARFKSLIVSNRWTQNHKKNKQAVFLLSPPRSGSTLLRVMLAGNDSLFSPPELDLLSFGNLKDRKNFFIENNLEIWNESVIRAIMELKDCDVETAAKIMDSYEERDFSTLDFFAELQNWAGNRIVVDKTPSYSIDINILNRIEDEFQEPKYIHLLRNPYPMIYSFIEAKLDEHFFKYNNPFSRQELAELIWLTSHQNILQLKEIISPDRYYQIKFEELLQSPKEELEKLCNFLNIEFQENMLKPYSGKKMTSGISAEKQMVGDFKFYLRNKIDSRVIDKWKNLHKEDFISDETKLIAEQFGYEFDDLDKESENQNSAISQIQKLDRNENLPLSSAQQRLWFLEQLEGPSANYNIVNAIEISGEFDFKVAEKCFNEIVSRHQVFRTKFETENGKPSASIVPLPDKTITIIDFQNNDKKNDIDSFLNNEARTPFDISKPPLFRFTFVKIDIDRIILVVTLHHIISDGWSMGILIKEFSELYDSFSKNIKSPLPELSLQYHDFSAWHNNELDTEKFRGKLEFWKNKLAGVSNVVSFPPDFPRPAEQNHQGNRIYFELDSNVHKKIIEISKNEDVTPYVILLSIYALLLSRYSGQHDLTIGTPISGRNRQEIESLIGFFVNTVVIRIKLNKNDTFIDLLSSVKNTLIESFEHSDYPFEKLLELVDPNRNMSYSPIFQTMFAYNDTTLENINLNRITLRPLKLDTKTSKFDITFELIERKSDYKVAVEYNTDLYHENTILRIIENFKEQLNIYLNSPEEMLYRSSFAGIKEQELIDDISNGDKYDHASDENFVSLFEKQVILSQDRIAAAVNKKSISFKDLNSRSNKIARFISSTINQAETDPEKPIGIVLDRSIELIESIIAVLKTGRPYLPIDPEFPKSRIDYIINDSAASLIITQSKYKDLLEGRDIRTLFIDSDEQTINEFDDRNLSQTIFPENLAYIIYTSGSTGNPKGVAVQHSSVINLYYSLHERIYKPFGNKKVNVSLNAPIQFDASVQQLVQLLSGNSLVIIPQEIKSDIELFNNYIIEHKIDVLDCVPTQLKLMMNSGLFDNNAAPSICLPGGEAIDETLWNSCIEKSSTKFFNMYGPTETTVDITIQDIYDQNNIPSLGKCVLNSNIHILDDHLNKVPIGVTGEIHIEGAGLARGYNKFPDKTAEVFIPNPYSKNPGDRLYRTGDLGKYDHRGNLIYIGRRDHQVKLRGYRIELGEIESQLKRHKTVQDAVVVLDQDSNDKIVAYVIADKEKISGTEIKEYLKDYLPEYMIPAGISYLENFPLTPNGKVDRKKLPKFEIDREALESKFEQPKTEKEVQLAEILKKLLNIDDVGIEDNFFELGGDSILSIQLVSEARNKGILIKPKNVFQYPTIKGLLSIAEKTEEQKIEIGSLEGEFPLTPIQKWFFEQEFENPNHWNQSLLLEFEQQFNKTNLSKTFDHLYEHHDALRMRFGKKENEWHQVYSAFGEVPFEIRKVNLSDEIEIKEEIVKIADFIQSSLNIMEGPLVKFVYIETLNKNYILIVAHHLVIDGISWRILTADLQNIYAQIESGNDSVSLPKTSSVGLWSKNLKEYAVTEQILSDLQFWKDQRLKQSNINKVSEEDIPNTENNAEEVSSSLEKEYTFSLIKEIPNKYNTDISEILLTAFVRANSSWRGERKISISLESHGRENIFENIDLSRTLGWFTSLYPIVLDLEDKINPIDSLKLIKEQLREVPQNGISYGILKYYDRNQDSSDLPHLSEISFNYLGQFAAGSQIESNFRILEEYKGKERSQLNKRPFQMDVIASIIDGKLHVKIIYNNKLWTNEEVGKLVSFFMNELKLLIETTIADSGGYTPSDFSDVELDDQDLDTIFSEINED